MAQPRVARIQLTSLQRRQLYGVRRRAWPNEGCALLLGTFSEGGLIARVFRIAETKNIANSMSAFEIDPEHQYCILAAASKEGLEQVGIYHSHPAPPEPSESDLEFMKYNPCVWVIDGKKRLRFRMKAYQLWQGFLLSVDIDIVPE
ncbi:MAG: M67 family metallopeptidase [Candidatus Hermodarchaeia archaeon]